MAEKSGSASRIAAIVLIGANLVFMMLCAAVFALGLWIITSPSSLSHVIQSFGDDTTKVLFPREALNVQLGIVLAVLSIFFFCIALMGFYGAINCSKFLLFMYSILVLLLDLLECSLIFYFTSNLIEKGIQVEDGQLTHILRLSFKCCERNYTSDAVEKIQPPWSCCGVDGFPNNCSADRTFEQNCQQKISSWLSSYQVAIYVPLTVLHIILSSCSLIRRAGSFSRSHS